MSPDEKKALAFYEGVFGYTHDSMDMGPQGTYYLLKQGDVMRGGLMRSPMPDTPPIWMPYVAVADCDATAAKATSLGAQIIVQPNDIPDVGRFAALIDPQGACIAFMKPFG
jgi:predicted enzyme related to lactoylglutathione lyase